MSTSGNANARIKSYVWAIPNNDVVDAKTKSLNLNRQSDRFPVDGPRPRGAWTATLEMIMLKADNHAEMYNHVLRLSATSERRIDVTENSSYTVKIYTRRSNGTIQHSIDSFTGKLEIRGDTLYFVNFVNEEKVVTQMTKFGTPDLCVEIKITEVLKKKPQSPSTPARNTRNSMAGKKRMFNGTTIHL